MPEEPKQNIHPVEKGPVIPTPEKTESLPKTAPEIKPEFETKPAPPAETQGEAPSVVPVPTEPPADQDVQKQVKDLKVLDKEKQVQVLSDLAFTKGLSYAVSVARGLNNAYVLDKLHDTLVDQLYEELVKRGKLKEL